MTEDEELELIEIELEQRRRLKTKTPEPEKIGLKEALFPAASAAAKAEYQPKQAPVSFSPGGAGFPGPTQKVGETTLSPEDQRRQAIPGAAVGDAAAFATRFAGAAAGSPREALNLLPAGPVMGIISDVTGATKALDAMAVTSATGGKKTMLQGMADPETGVLRTAREKMSSAIADQVKDLKDVNRTYLQKVGDTFVAELAAAGYVTASMLEDPLFVASLASQVVKGVPKIASKIAPKVKTMVAEKTKLDPTALVRAAHNTEAVEAAAGSEEKLTYDLADEITKIRQANKAALESEKNADVAKYEKQVSDLMADFEKRKIAQEAEHEGKLAAREKQIGDEAAAFESETQAQKGALETGVLSERPGVPVAKAGEISPYESGKRLETAAQEARKAIGTKYRDKLEEGFKKSGIAKIKLPRKTLSGEKAKAVTGSTQFAAVNPMQEFIDDALVRIGYDRAKGYQQLEGASKQAVDWLAKKWEGAGNIRDMEDLLKFRKNFQDDLYASSSGQNAMFPRSGQAGNDFRFLNSIYHESNNLIAEIPAQKLGKEAGETWRKMWNDLRKGYAEPEGAIEELAEGLGKAAAPEDFMARMKNVKTDDVLSMKAAAKEHKEIAPLVAEMETMAFDNMVRVSLDAGNQNAFSPEKFIRVFNTEDPAKLKAVLGNERYARIKQAVNKYKLPEKPTIPPKPEKPKALAKPDLPEKPDWKMGSNEPAFPELAGASEAVNQGKIRSNIANMGQDPKVFALRELEFLDNALGLKGKDKYTEKILDAWAANKLGIARGGKLPGANPLRTGYATSDKVIGGSAGSAIAGSVGYAVAGPQGATILAPIGMLVGHSLGGKVTSPSTAVAVYRAMNALSSYKPTPRAVSLMKAIKRTSNAETLAKLKTQLERETARSMQDAPQSREEALATP